jgi:hypothetical protein
MARQQAEYVKAVADVIQLIEDDEDYLSIVLDERFAKLQLEHKKMTAIPKRPPKRAPKKRVPTKAMQNVQKQYEKDMKMFQRSKQPT